MTATAHTLVAGAIASRFPDPVMAASIALLSHFAMDSIPHWDIGTNWRTRNKRITGLLAITDTVIGITLAYFLFSGNAPTLTLAVAVIASVLPDWMETPWYIFFSRQNKTQPGKSASFWELCSYRIYRSENIFHTKMQFPGGLMTQILTVGFLLFLLK